MIEVIYPYLVSMAATIVVVVVCIIAFFSFYRASARYHREAKNLPEACRYADLQSRVQDTELELERLQDDLIEAKQVIQQRDEAAAYLRDTREELLSLKSEQEEQSRVRTELEALQNKVAEEKEGHLKLVQQLEAGKLNIEMLKQQEQELSEKVAALQETANSTAAANQELATKKASLQQEVASLDSQWKELTKQVDDAKADLKRRLSVIEQEEKVRKASVERTLESLRQEILALQQEIVDLELRLAAKRTEWDTAQQQADERLAAKRTEWDTSQQQADERLAAKQRELEKLQQQAQEFQREQGELHATVEGLLQQKRGLEETELPRLQQDFERLMAQTGRDETKRTVELWQPVFNVEDYHHADETDELERLQHLDQYLKGLRLYFSKRVLYAFHTSLKVADISPLVVLAGISGTGKSELPRRYAEAMGFHFLSMAVQPRWDSPQDMFGFFNYLEHRYRATELARLLIQMDPFHDRTNRGWQKPEDWNNSLRDQMLLVLLDEMNLARVEHYFSEFLSRLETRRGIKDKTDDLQRKDAEIRLEVGGSQEDSPLMRLFVDTNVLFVGTMNEDETTQSLSDKVVDRANVLRFGRPPSLGESTISDAASIEVDAADRLPYKAWQKWHRSEHDLDSNIRDEIGGWVKNLGDAMEEIDRPFAHRTSQAIHRYVANYPEQSEQGVKFAMADQIEQKLLPKFRGLDLADVNDSLNKIVGIVRQLGDEALERAIESQRSRHQFMFSGVDRSSSMNNE